MFWQEYAIRMSVLDKKTIETAAMFKQKANIFHPEGQGFANAHTFQFIISRLENVKPHQI